MKMKRVKEAYQSGIDTLQEYNENKQQLIREKEHLQFRLDELLSVPIENNIPEEMHKRISTVCSILQSEYFDDTKKNQALSSIVEKIVYNKDTDTLDIYYFYGDSSPQTRIK